MTKIFKYIFCITLLHNIGQHTLRYLSGSSYSYLSTIQINTNILRKCWHTLNSSVRPHLHETDMVVFTGAASVCSPRFLTLIYLMQQRRPWCRQGSPSPNSSSQKGTNVFQLSAFISSSLPLRHLAVNTHDMYTHTHTHTQINTLS